jgi:pyruvate,orthophosphate dikinase
VPAGRGHAQAILKQVRALTAINPLLAHRGVRLGKSPPEIPSLQIQAILAAVATCAREGIEVHPVTIGPQVMLRVATSEELARIHCLPAFLTHLHRARV